MIDLPVNWTSLHLRLDDQTTVREHDPERRLGDQEYAFQHSVRSLMPWTLCATPRHGSRHELGSPTVSESRNAHITAIGHSAHSQIRLLTVFPARWDVLGASIRSLRFLWPGLGSRSIPTPSWSRERIARIAVPISRFCPVFPSRTETHVVFSEPMRNRISCCFLNKIDSRKKSHLPPMSCLAQLHRFWWRLSAITFWICCWSPWFNKFP